MSDNYGMCAEIKRSKLITGVRNAQKKRLESGKSGKTHDDDLQTVDEYLQSVVDYLSEMTSANVTVGFGFFRDLVMHGYIPANTQIEVQPVRLPD